MDTWPVLASLPQPSEFKAEKELSSAPGPVAGVYCLWGAKGALLYIGQSCDILRRLGEHRAIAAGRDRRRAELAAEFGKGPPDPRSEEFKTATWTPVADHAARLQIEGILILASTPTQNRMLYLGIAGGGRVYEVGYNSARSQKTSQASRAGPKKARLFRDKARVDRGSKRK